MEHCKFTYHRTSFGMNFVIWLAVRGYFVRSPFDLRDQNSDNV